MLCCMWDARERGKLEGTSDQLCRLIGCLPEELTRAIEEISVTKTGNVTVCNDFITVINRRMFKAEKERSQARERVSRHREKKAKKRVGNGDITLPSSSSISSSSNNTVTKKTSASDDAAHSQSKDFFLTKKKRKLTGKRLETFEQFWNAFGYKKGKAEAADAWMDIPELTNALVEKIVQAAEREAKARPDKIAKGTTPIYAQGWISGRRWEDEDTGSSGDSLHEELKRRGLA